MRAARNAGCRWRYDASSSSVQNPEAGKICWTTETFEEYLGEAFCSALRRGEMHQKQSSRAASDFLRSAAVSSETCSFDQARVLSKLKRARTQTS